MPALLQLKAKICGCDCANLSDFVTFNTIDSPQNQGIMIIIISGTIEEAEAEVTGGIIFLNLEFGDYPQFLGVVDKKLRKSFQCHVLGERLPYDTNRARFSLILPALKMDKIHQIVLTFSKKKSFAEIRRTSYYAAKAMDDSISITFESWCLDGESVSTAAGNEVPMTVAVDDDHDDALLNDLIDVKDEGVNQLSRNEL